MRTIYVFIFILLLNTILIGQKNTYFGWIIFEEQDFAAYRISVNTTNSSVGDTLAYMFSAKHDIKPLPRKISEWKKAFLNFNPLILKIESHSFIGNSIKFATQKLILEDKSWVKCEFEGKINKNKIIGELKEIFFHPYVDDIRGDTVKTTDKITFIKE